MKKDSSDRSMHFESMLWQNELEYNRRELAIFESFLLNKGGQLQPHQLTAMMSQLHQYVQSVNKLLDEIRQETQIMPLIKNREHPRDKENPNQYIREEMFYFEQSYRQFRHSFCCFAERTEVA